MVLFINCASLVGATSNLNQNDKENNNKHIALYGLKQIKSELLCNTDFDNDIMHYIDRILNIAINDENLQYLYLYDSNQAKKMMENIVLNEMKNHEVKNSSDDISLTSIGGNGRIYYISRSIPYVDQIEEYYCGPAATIQALIGNGKISNSPSNYTKDALDSMADDLQTNTDGTVVRQITNRMNMEYSSTMYYDSWLGSLYDESNEEIEWSGNDFLDYIASSLANNYTPIFQCRHTEDLGYYNGYSYKHYFVVSELNYMTNTVLIVDPHYNSTFGGYRRVTVDEFLEAMEYGWVIALGTME